MSEGEEKIDALIRELEETRAGLSSLKSEIKRLADAFEGMLKVEPPKTKRAPEAQPEGSLEEVVGRVAIKGFGALFGPGKKRRAT